METPVAAAEPHPDVHANVTADPGAVPKPDAFTYNAADDSAADGAADAVADPRVRERHRRVDYHAPWLEVAYC